MIEGTWLVVDNTIKLIDNMKQSFIDGGYMVASSDSDPIYALDFDVKYLLDFLTNCTWYDEKHFFYGTFKDRDIDVWMVEKSFYFENLEDAVRFGLQHNQKYIYDIDGDCLIALEVTTKGGDK